jgi:hypothetical protein
MFDFVLTCYESYAGLGERCCRCISKCVKENTERHQDFFYHVLSQLGFFTMFFQIANYHGPERYILKSRLEVESSKSHASEGVRYYCFLV